ncbi:hypothetical protein [Candidatus Ruminimicrobiellum ovillum]|uniref:hypothetical protein n=1 Tax=Candidatus Ruminimicrobiellum ovillum TaxID=1947927 RepID=UPI00355ABE26
MKKNIMKGSISSAGLLHKFFSCVIVFFMLMSSICVAEIKTDISLVETAKISADTLLVQFFYISTLPLNVISKMFVNTEEKAPITAPASSQNKNNTAQNSTSAKASFGYSILPNTISLSQAIKTKTVKVFTLLDKVKKSRTFMHFEVYKFVCIENALLFGFIMMLLLAILLTRRNVGNDNIVTIKNNKLARLI